MKYKCLPTVLLVLVVTELLVACVANSVNPNPTLPVIHRSQSFSYVGMTVEQVIDDADIIFLGQVTSISPSRWNQDTGEYWEDVDSDMASLQYYEVTLEVTDVIVDEFGLSNEVSITVLGPSPADVTPATDNSEVQHTLAETVSFREGEKVLLFVEKVPLAWRNGVVERLVLVGGPQGKYTITDDGRALNASTSERDMALSDLLEQITARRHVRP